MAGEEKHIMDCPEQVTEFWMKQKSTTAIVDNFIEQFMEAYRDATKREQEALVQCVQQMFRKYYYSVLDPDASITPAAIVNALCEREFGGAFMAVPTLKISLIGTKISRLHYVLHCIRPDRHPLVADLELLLQKAEAGLVMEHPGILTPAEQEKLKWQFMLEDRHYLNILGLLALEAGLLECRAAAGAVSGKPTAKAAEFRGWDETRKFAWLVDGAMRLCSKTLSQAFPEVAEEFTVPAIAALLRKPRHFEKVMETVFKKMGVDLQQLDSLLMTGDVDEFAQSNGTELEKLNKFLWIQIHLDLYFITPFGYYLQLIQPLYPEIYDPAMEMDDLLEDLADFKAMRSKLFAAVAEFDLTPLGENWLLAGKGKKPQRNQAIPDTVADQALHQMIVASQEYLDLDDDWDEADLADETAETPFEADGDAGRLQPPSEDRPPAPAAAERSKAKVIDFSSEKKRRRKESAGQ